MWDKFSNDARNVIIRAQEEAKQMRQKFLEPEHILLAIVKSPESKAYKILKRLAVNPAAIGRIIEKGQSVGEPEGEYAVQFSSRSRDVLQLAYEELQKTSEETIGSEHILLGIYKERGEASRILRSQQVSLSELRSALRAYEEEEWEEAEEETSPDAPQLRQEETPALDKFGEDLTQLAREGQLDPVIGRHEEIERVIQVLSKRTKNNPVLVGDPGVGKTAIVEGLAQRIAEGRVPDSLKKKRVITLDLAGIVAGTKYRGEFEERLKRILSEIKKNRGNIIIFIDEIHTLVGAGAAEGAIDASNILKPSLARGELRCIGATTLSEYRKYIEKSAALERRFQPILVREPTVSETVEILKGLRKRYEEHHKVHIPDESLLVAAELSKRYISDRFLPDKAIDLMDEAASRVKIKASFPPREIQEIREKLTEMEKEKKRAILGKNFERCIALRDEMKRLQNEMAKEEERWKAYSQRTVSPEVIAQVVHHWTGIPVSRLTSTEAERLLHIEEEISRRLVGQEEVVRTLSRALRRSRAGLKDVNRPTGSFLFLGPTGVGKTEMAKVLAETVFGDEKHLIRLDMSEYMEKFNVSRLIGAPPGYVGYEEGGQLTEAVRRQPYSIVLFDEIEKAHPDIYNILLQIFEEGSLTDGQGTKVNFKNTIVILTSNMGTRLTMSTKSMGFRADREEALARENYEQMKERILREVRESFRPELLARIDEILVFKPLTMNEIIQIVDLYTERLNELLSKQHIRLVLTPAVKRLVAQKGFLPEQGARPLRRAFQHLLEEPLSDAILRGDCKENDTIIAEATAEEEIQFKPVGKAEVMTPSAPLLGGK